MIFDVFYFDFATWLNLLSEIFKEFTLWELNLVHIDPHVYWLRWVLLVRVLIPLVVSSLKTFALVLGLVLLTGMRRRFVEISLIFPSLVWIGVHFVELRLVVAVGYTHWHEGRLAVHLLHVRRHPILSSRLGLTIRHLIRLRWESSLIPLIRHAHIRVLPLSIPIRNLGVHLRLIIVPLLGNLSSWIGLLIWVSRRVGELSILRLSIHHLLRLRRHFRRLGRFRDLVVEVLGLLIRICAGGWS